MRENAKMHIRGGIFLIDASLGLIKDFDEVIENCIPNIIKQRRAELVNNGPMNFEAGKEARI